MIRWAVIDETNTDQWMQTFMSMSEAIANAQQTWLAMSKTDKGRRKAFFVGLINAETDAQDIDTYSLDCEGDIDGDVRVIVWSATADIKPLTFRDLVKASKLNMTQFCKAYGIPYRTAQNWYAGKTIHDYILSMLAVAVYSNI